MKKVAISLALCSIALEAMGAVPPADDGRVERARFVSSLIKPGDVGVEIGVFAGVFAHHVLVPKQPEKLYLIDPWQDNDAFFENVRDLFASNSKVEVIKAKSEDVVNRFPDAHFDYVYVDGEHSYAAVWRDLSNYFPKLKVGGRIIGDDYGWSGVREAVDEFVKLHKDEVEWLEDPYLGRTGGQFVIKKISPLDAFLKNYSDPIYQDVVIGKTIHAIGSDHCEPRYNLIKPILDTFDRPFSVLDLGAAQGYFSFRIASDYPQSSCVMVESNDTSYYARHGDMLRDLLQYNSHLKNVSYLNKRLNLSDLASLNEQKHFDILIAFLVVHLMHDTLKEQVKILDALLSLTDNLIIEVANDVGVIHTSYVEHLASSLGAEYLGEVKRHKDPGSQSTGKLFWFKSKTPRLLSEGRM